VKVFGSEMADDGDWEGTSRSGDGTQEWSDMTVNCYRGCPHKCKYCYARMGAMRFRQVEDVESWGNPVPNEKMIKKGWRKHEGIIMFPSTHDVTPDIEETGGHVIPGTMTGSFTVLGKLLKAKCKVLWVTKPHKTCATEAIKLFGKNGTVGDFRDTLGYRITCASTNDDTLKLWEPNAKPFAERKECLKMMFEAGFRTSVSLEPLLSVDDAPAVLSSLDQYVTGHFWMGKMNYFGRVVKDYPSMKATVGKAKEDQSDLRIIELYNKLKGNKKARWKKSIRLTLARYGVSVPSDDLPSLD
jgi:DNA repair photolyase